MKKSAGRSNAFDKMKREFSAGGIVFNKAGQVLLTKHSKNKHWSFPKGLIDPGQTPEEAAVREVREEGGVDAEIVHKVGYSKYVYNLSTAKITQQSANLKGDLPAHSSLSDEAQTSESKTGRQEKIFKVVTYFLMKYKSGDPKDHDWEMEEAGWYEPEDALKQLTFSQDKQLLKKALEMYGK